MSDYDEEETTQDFANGDEVVVAEGVKSPWKKGEYVSPADEFMAAENELQRLLISPKKADFVGRRPHGTGAGALVNGIGGYLGDATDEMELGFFVVPGFEKKEAFGPEIPAHGGKRLVIKNNHPNVRVRVRPPLRDASLSSKPYQNRPVRAIETVPLRSVVPAASRSRPFPRVWLIPLCGSPSVTLRVNRTCPLIPLIPHVSLM